MSRIYLYLFLSGLAACGERAVVYEDDDTDLIGDALPGLAMPIRMSEDTMDLSWRDFFPKLEALDSVRMESFGYAARLQGDRLHLSVSEGVPAMSLLSFYAGGKRYDVVCMRSGKRPAEVKHRSAAAGSVALAGEMTGWIPVAMERDSTGLWKTALRLYPGKYQYQLVIDGVWQLDPDNPERADNGIGGVNSVLQVGGEFAGGASRLRCSFRGDTLAVDFDALHAQTPIVLWENFRLKALPGNSATLLYRLPRRAAELRRSHLRVWAANGRGQISDALIPLQNGKPVRDPKQLDRYDFHSQILYFMLVDRFADGNPANNAPVREAAIHPKANYQGGDLQGIIGQLKAGYFDSLSINTLWLSPLTLNPRHGETEYPAPRRRYSGYHGYWPISATAIDPRLGTGAELKELVRLAHEKGMNVILDYVSNHVHQENPIYKAHPEWATPLVLPDGRKNIRLWDEHRLTTWFDEFLPTLDYSRPEVVDLMSDSALFMLQEYGLDGFRHDATKHIPEAFWLALTLKIKRQCERPIFQIGETFGSRELIAGYVSSGQMDGQFDFNLYFDLRSALLGGSMRRLDESLHTSTAYYGAHSLMGNITGNHDIARFISYAGGALRPDEDDKEAGWKRDIQVVDTLGYKRLGLLTAFLMTAPGLPVVYYGDDIGMPGAGDPDNRRMMRFGATLSRHERAVLEQTRNLAALRRNSMPLLYGDFQTLYVQDQVYAYVRTYLDERVLVILNNSDRPINPELEGKTWSVQPYAWRIERLAAPLQ